MSHSMTEGKFEVAGFKLEWSVSHYSGESDPQDRFRGRSARVRLEGGKCKELVLTFPPREYTFARDTNTQAFRQRLQTCVAKAIELGWNPESRGKAYQLDAADCE